MARGGGAYEILEINDGGGIRAAWPNVYSKRDGAKHVSMPALTQKLGILFAPSAARPVQAQSKNQRRTTELIEQLGDTASFHQNFHENFTDWLPFYWQGYTQTTRYTYVLGDISDLTSVWNGMRPNHRRDIQRATRLGIRIIDSLDIAKFLELNRKTFTRQGREPLASDELILRLDRACSANAGRKIFAGVDSQGRIHAAVYIAWSNDTAYYLVGGERTESSQEQRPVAGTLGSSDFRQLRRETVRLRGFHAASGGARLSRSGAGQLPYSSITKVPPAPTSLSGFLRASIRFRWNRARRTIANRF